MTPTPPAHISLKDDPMTEEKQIDPVVSQLRQAREEAGIKQNEISATLGLEPTRLSSYENGRVSPKIDMVRDWAYALDFDLALNKIERPGRRRRSAAPPAADLDIPEDLAAVYLSRYQAALAMGMLMAQAAASQEKSPSLADDLRVIADIVARSIH